jgi:cytochrome P450
MPKGRLHLSFSKWANQYGDTISLKILGQTMIVIHSPSLMKEVIDKRANTTSNRPKSIIADMIVPGGMNMGLVRHTTETWKSMRKASNFLLGPESIRKTAPYRHAEAAQLMGELVNQPEGWFEHIQRYTTSLVLASIYGLRGPTLQNPNVKDFQEVHPQFLFCLEFGTMPPVDLFPILTYVPERFAGWKRLAKRVRFLHEKLYDRLLATVERRVASGQGVGSIMEELLTIGPSMGLLTREHIMHVGGVLIEGSDTSSSTMQFIVLMLCKYPEVQRKAQQEMDDVVGPDRTPNENDLPKLKYLQALIEEAFRFRPVGPLGIPHEMVEDAVVDGMLFPKGAVVFYNLFGMFHDERYFDRPSEFIPERFLKHPLGVKEGIKDDPARRTNMIFGGGKRVCPGSAFAKTSLEMNTANIVWGLDILPGIDPNTGKEVFPDLDDYTDGIVAAPKPIPVRIRPRSTHHKDMIDRQFQSMADVLSRYEYDLSPADKEFNAKYRDI